MKNNFIQFIVLFFLVICFFNGCGNRVNEIVERSKDNELIYYGKINSKNFTKLKKVFEEAEVKPSLLKINSSGGSGEIGIDIGNWIKSNDISVEVTEMCASSCANYIFPAGKQKILGQHALLLFHEGAYQTDIAEQIGSIYRGNSSYVKGANFSSDKDEACATSVKPTPDKSSETIEETQGLDCIDKRIDSTLDYQARESKFYLSLGIDPNYPYYGQKDKRYVGSDNLYYYSLESIDVMGLRGILLKDEQWTPKQNPALRESFFLVEPNFSDFASSTARLGMTNLQRFISENNAILPSHQMWLYRTPELLAKHQSVVAMLSNRALQENILVKLKSTVHEFQNHPISIVCGPKECEIQITYIGSFESVLAIDWETIIGKTTPQLKFSNLSFQRKPGVGFLVIVNFIDA